MNLMLNKLKSRISILIIILLLFSCEKTSNDIHTQLSGTLYAANSQEYLANAKVELVQINYVGYASRDVILDSTRTDAQGNYHFDFRVNYNSRYKTHQLICYYPNYYSTRDITGPFPIDGSHFELDGKQKYNPELHPYAWLKVKLNFTKPVNRFGMNPAFGEIFPVDIINPGRQEFVVKTMGNADNLLSFFIHTNDTSITIVDTIWCGKNDTTLKIIYY